MNHFALKASTALLLSLPLAAPALAQDTNVNGNIVLQSNGQPGYLRDVHLSDNYGGLRFYGTDRLTMSNSGASIQFFGNNHPQYGGMAFMDAGATDNGAIVLRTSPTGGQATERFRINALGNIGIGTTMPTQRLEIVGSIKLSGQGAAIFFPDGTSLTSAAVGGGGSVPSGTSLVNAINDASTGGLISDARISPNVARLAGTNSWSGANVFSGGLSANGSAISGVGDPVAATDAMNKRTADARYLQLLPGADQISVGDANGTAPMINVRGGSTCCSVAGYGYAPAWFKVFQNGSFVATGILGVGTPPMQGPGLRTSWYTYKGAFRSGNADYEWDDANVGFYSWAGGDRTTASGLYSLAFGSATVASGNAAVAFGSGTEVRGTVGFASGGSNRVCGIYGVAFGLRAQSGGPLVNGHCDPSTSRGTAAVAIGVNVIADQDYTIALGKYASNDGFSGTFIWSDASATGATDTFKNTANNQFAARATGGFRFRTNLAGTTGCDLPAGSGVFNCTSSRTTKENFRAVDGSELLGKIRALDVTSWNYTSEGAQVRHLGPMAEDFYKAFGLGVGNTSIGVQDLAGVSLAAVKALDARTAELQAKIGEVDQLRAELSSLKASNAALEQRLAAIEARLGGK